MQHFSTNAPSSFPPGPPPVPFFYAIPGSDLTLELSALGLISGRNESEVDQVLNEAFQASLNPYRPEAVLPRAGYKLQHGSFLLGVTPRAAAMIYGNERLTWGKWTDSLTGIHLYIEQYRGYDFLFEVLVTPEVGPSDPYVIGAGFAMTRGR